MGNGQHIAYNIDQFQVLIPVFALGRAQELCILLESYWERLDLKVPIYFSTGLAEKATKVPPFAAECSSNDLVESVFSIIDCLSTGPTRR